MSAITFDGISKDFDGVLAVDDLSLHVADGEFLVLLGPSGCGKSTALRMLAGLEDPSSGTISIGEEIVNEVDARHRDVAMVFQSYALYPHMTVAKNIESPLVGRRSERTDKAARVELVGRVAEMLGLADLLDRKPAQLSGGQRQRVALARAIVRRPAVFCMDEPLSNLDAKLRTQTRADIVALHRDLEATFVYVTHDQIEAMTMATRIAVLDAGRLQQVGDPHTIYERPANLFVARFVGSPPMNVFAGRIEQDASGEWSVALAGSRLTLGDRWPDLRPDQSVHAGVRPEHLHVADDGIAAVVDHAEWLGHEQIVQVDVGGEPISVRDTGENSLLRPGTAVHLMAAPRHVHLFDVETGARLAESGV